MKQNQFAKSSGHQHLMQQEQGAGAGVGAATIAGLAAFFFLDPVRWSEDRDAGSPGSSSVALPC